MKIEGMGQAYLCLLDEGLSRGVHHLVAGLSRSNSHRIFLFFQCCVQQLMRSFGLLVTVEPLKVETNKLSEALCSVQV